MSICNISVYLCNHYMGLVLPNLGKKTEPKE